MKIRAHHLLCLQGYQGYGYSDRFQANLEEVIALIAAVPDLEIEVVAENDVICSYCPHAGENGCRKDDDSAESIRLMDLKVLQKLGIKKGTRDKAQNLFKLTETKLKTGFKGQEICGDCQWKEKCLVSGV